jgi:acyl-CoA reductase-like NAD-dependent aldehyde dehydrogenase
MIEAPTIPVHNAATGEVIAEVAESGADGVAAAYERALVASRDWRAIGAAARGDVIAAFGRVVAEHANELATLDARNAGNPITGMRRGAMQGAKTLGYFAGLALQLTGETVPATPDHLHYTVREPFGVVGIITPFNHPTLFATARTAAPLVAGNAVILKPAHQTPLSALRLAELADEHLPSGLLTVVTGGGLTGSALVRHPEIRRIGFTGGVPTALRIAADAAASGTVKRISYELGGKNAMIILPDVDLDVAAAAAVEGMNLTRVAGQSCGSTSRLFVHESIRQPLLERVAERLTHLRFGPPEEESTQIGSLVSEQQRERVEHYVRLGEEEGAKLVVGGRRPTEPPFDRGFYFPPTLFDGVRPEMTIARDEIFGPVLSTIGWEEESKMLEAVNATRYGLTASIYTNDLAAAHRLASAVQAGYVWINDVEKRWIGVPFGGQKDSGTGTEYSIEELFSHTQNKSISVNLQ